MPLAFRSWEDICQPKENVVLGIRDRNMVNKSLLIHVAYNIANKKNLFLTSVLKAKYFHNTSFGLLIQMDKIPSFGLLFCRLKRSYATMLLSKSMQEIPPSGQLLGVQLGIPSTATYFSLSQLILYPL